MGFKIGDHVYYLIWMYKSVNEKSMTKTYQIGYGQITGYSGDYIYYHVRNNELTYRLDPEQIFKTREDAEIDLEQRILLEI